MRINDSQYKLNEIERITDNQKKKKRNYRIQNGTITDANPMNKALGHVRYGRYKWMTFSFVLLSVVILFLSDHIKSVHVHSFNR